MIWKFNYRHFYHLNQVSKNIRRQKKCFLISEHENAILCVWYGLLKKIYEIQDEVWKGFILVILAAMIVTWPEYLVTPRPYTWCLRNLNVRCCWSVSSFPIELRNSVFCIVLDIPLYQLNTEFYEPQYSIIYRYLL